MADVGNALATSSSMASTKLNGGGAVGTPKAVPAPRARACENNATATQIAIAGGTAACSAGEAAAAAAAAAAADSSAMPPPPAVHGSMRSAATAPPHPAAPRSTNAGGSPAPAALARAPHAQTRVIPSAAPSSTVGKSGLGTPSPLAREPPTTSATARPVEQRLTAGNYAQTTRKATPIAVPATARMTVPQPVLSSAHSASAKAKAPASQQRVVPSYLAKSVGAPSTATANMSTMKRVVGTAPAPGIKPPISAMNGRQMPKPTMASSTPVRQPMSSIPAPSPVASLHHRPNTITSGVPSGVSHHMSHSMPVGVSQPMAPEPMSAGSSSGGSSAKKKSGHPLRRGKWTSEEEAYAARLINEFKSGLLPLTDGTTLRNFLSKLLNCDPMRISKKFVGNNCIGKQVFRRRVADINRLTPEEIQQMRVELSELERRFFDRVAQTNRVKTPGVSAAIAGGAVTVPMSIVNVGAGKLTRDEIELDRPPTPPWLRPPSSYKPKGKFAERLKARAAPPAPPAVPQMQKVSVSSAPPSVNVKSDTEKAMAAIQRSGSSLDRLAQAASSGDIPRTESALEQLARTASAAKFVEDIVNGESPLNEKQAQGSKKLSQSTMQGSFEALMSMDIHSVENLVELASTSNSSTLLSDLAKSTSKDGLKHEQSSANLSHRFESFIKSLSSANLLKPGIDSGAALETLLANATSSGNIFDAEKFSKRIESSTGFSQLRTEDGLANGAHNSVEDFLSLVASGDIPHQDPNMLKVPLQKVMQQTGIGAKGSKRKLSQQRLVALANRLAGSSTQLSEMSCGGSALKKQKRKS